jgi:copper(I)-binding protein
MKMPSRHSAVKSACVTALCLAILPIGNSFAAENIAVTDAWIRALPADLPSGGYFTLHNGGPKPLTLTGASSPGCGMLMLHKSENMGGMSSMQHVAEVDVPAGGTIKFAPGGYHLMCMDTKPVIKPGGAVPVILTFKDGSNLTVKFAVRNAAGKE